MEVIIKYSGQPRTENIEILGHGFGIIETEPDRLSELYEQTWIEDIEPSRTLCADVISAQSASCIPFARESAGISGEGCAVAVIDTGIDYTHPEFIDKNGRTRLLCLWDLSKSGTPPEGFRKGTMYTSDDINAALQSEEPLSVIPQPDLSGHGTAVAGIAAGNSGVAPGAVIIAVKLSAEKDEYAVSTDIMRALRFVIDISRKNSLPAAVNISYGMNEGAHDGDSLFEEYIAAVSSEWKTSIVVPTGNEGAAGHHYSGIIGSTATEVIDMFTAPFLTSFYISMWKNYADELSVRLVLPNITLSPELSEINGDVLFRSGNINIRGNYGMPTRYSTDQEVLWTVRAESGYIPQGLWRILISSGKVANGRIDIWLPTVGQVSGETYFANPDNALTMTIPSTADKVIRVAGYNSRITSPAEFSGTGGSCTVPDVASPAVRISAPFAGGGYGYFTGTSFAAPFVTGSAALLMEWGIIQGNDPFFYGEKIRAQLRKDANRITDYSYPDTVSGYGTLCLKIPRSRRTI